MRRTSLVLLSLIAVTPLADAQVNPGGGGGASYTAGSGLTLIGSAFTLGDSRLTYTNGALTTTSLALNGATLGSNTLSITGKANFDTAGSLATPTLSVGNSTTGFYSVSTTGFGISVNGVNAADYGITTANAWNLAGGILVNGPGYFNSSIFFDSDNTASIGGPSANRPATVYVGTGLNVAGSAGLASKTCTMTALGATITIVGGIITATSGC